MRRKSSKAGREAMDLRAHIRQVPDFPRPGILFHDISTLLANAEAWAETVDRMTRWVEPFEPELLVGIESRGFLVAAPLAYNLRCGFVMVRKKGKLPGATIPYTYDLEYGSDTVEVQADALRQGQRVVVLDDLLATGGTLAAAIRLLRNVGAEVAAAACIIELAFLRGRDRLDVPFNALISYET
jgi:adenine phosphoribosyltransferase